MDNQAKGILKLLDGDKIEVFEPSYQNKFIKTFIEDRDGWAQQIHDVLFSEYFDSYQKIIVEYEKEYFEKYRVVADYDDLRDIINDREKDGMMREHLFGLLEKIQTMELLPERRRSVQDRAYQYFKSRILQLAMIHLAKEWGKHNYDGMKTILESALKRGEPKKIGHDYMKDVEKRLKKNFRTPISALPTLDVHLGGGLAPGELGVVLAPTGGGKSMMLVRFAASALLAGKKVVYYSMELAEAVIGQRFDACLNDIHLNEVWDFGAKIKETIGRLELLKAGLVIQGYNTGEATINNLYSHLQSLESLYGFVPDIIFVDYADIMKPLNVYSDKRHTLTGIYESLRGMAGDLAVPIWTASQTNRTAMNQEDFGLETIGESLGKAATADVVIGVGRTEPMKKAQKARIKILKNRNGQEGFAEDYIFDTSKIYIKLASTEEMNRAEIRANAGIKDRGKELGAAQSQYGNNVHQNIQNIQNTQGNPNIQNTLEQQNFNN